MLPGIHDRVSGTKHPNRHSTNTIWRGAKELNCGPPGGTQHTKVRFHLQEMLRIVITYDQLCNGTQHPKLFHLRKPIRQIVTSIYSENRSPKSCSKLF